MSCSQGDQLMFSLSEAVESLLEAERVSKALPREEFSFLKLSICGSVISEKGLGLLKSCVPKKKNARASESRARAKTVIQLPKLRWSALQVQYNAHL